MRSVDQLIAMTQCYQFPTFDNCTMVLPVLTLDIDEGYMETLCTIFATFLKYKIISNI